MVCSEVDLRSHTPNDTRPIATDPRSRELIDLAARVALTNVSVLLSGESGVGKEVIAHFIHTASHRATMPFCAINCAAIPDSMLEAELFGHEKGAYTGASQARAGKFEQAHNGTLLLDEITEMPVLLQAKLLRVLQEREVERLGGRRPIKIDVRVIATTNRDARAAVEQGLLREDLYYRLNVFPLRVPALRERPADIPVLARHFVSKYSQGAPVLEFATDALELMLNYGWPGNVRELENAIQRALVLTDGRLLRALDLALEGPVSGTQHAAANAPPVTSSMDEKSRPLSASLESVENSVIARALKDHRRSRVAAAAALGISERTLRYKLQKLRAQGVDLLEESLS
jgi:two-component system response regulator FlrC